MVARAWLDGFWRCLSISSTSTLRGKIRRSAMDRLRFHREEGSPWDASVHWGLRPLLVGRVDAHQPRCMCRARCCESAALKRRGTSGNRILLGLLPDIPGVKETYLWEDILRREATIGLGIVHGVQYMVNSSTT